MPRFLHRKAAPRGAGRRGRCHHRGQQRAIPVQKSYAAAATVSVAPSTFAAPAGVSNVSSQLLDGSGSGDNQLLDN